MKITTLVENIPNCRLKATHGLALYIETPKHNILFDVGPNDDTLFKNCDVLGIDLSKVDIMILSHGHFDHGGALQKFLRINPTAKVYAQKKAFEKHYAKAFLRKTNIGVSPHFQNHPQVTLLDGDYVIDDELTLFTVTDTQKYRSSANDMLYTQTGKDDFSHEHNLIISGDTNVLIMGCGHCGVINILEKAAVYNPKVCIGGYHLWNPKTKKTVSDDLLEDIAQELANYDIRFYTGHCTGGHAYSYFKKQLPHMYYLACGETIVV